MSNFIKIISLFLLSNIYAFGYVRTGAGPGSYTYTIDAATQADIQSACTAAVTGDVVYIPSSLGPISITDQIEVPAQGITITGDTVITGAGTASPSASTETILLDDNTSGSAGNQSIFQLEFYATSGRLTFQKLTLKAGTRTATSIRGQLVLYSSGSATTTSSNAEVRITNCKFEDCQGRPASFYSWSGVMDHCWIQQNGQSGMAFLGPQTHAGANMSWSRPVSEIMGTVGGAFYVEDCTITQSGAPRSATDGFAGARFVIRHCYIEDSSVENHGTESGYKRGTRWMESYENTFVASGSPSNPGEYAHLYRSGGGVVYNNTLTGTWPGLFRMNSYRSIWDYQPFSGAYGTNVFDKNYATLYESGTHNGTEGVLRVLTDTSKSWSPTDKWVGYSVLNTTTGRGSVVTSSTANTITLSTTPAGDGIGPSYNCVVWHVGDAYEIRKIEQALDQPGTGQSDLISGTTDSTPGTPAAWPNQAVQPIYYSGNSGASTVSPDIYYHVISGTHYINSAMPGYVALTYPHPFVGVDTTSPTLNSSIIPSAGTSITLYFDESVTRNSTTPTVSLSGGACTLTYSSGSGTGSHVYTLSRTVNSGETGTLSVTLGANAWEDSSGNDVATISGASITNNSTQGSDVTSPTLTSSTIPSGGTTISLLFTESTTRNSGTPTVSLSGGACTLTYSSGSGTSTHVYTLSRTVYSGETGTLSATLGSNVWEDAAGNDVANISGASVTNNSTQSVSSDASKGAKTKGKKGIHLLSK